jgi:hypothetical protein
VVLATEETHGAAIAAEILEDVMSAAAVEIAEAVQVEVLTAVAAEPETGRVAKAAAEQDANSGKRARIKNYNTGLDSKRITSHKL